MPAILALIIIAALITAIENIPNALADALGLTLILGIITTLIGVTLWLGVKK